MLDRILGPKDKLFTIPGGSIDSECSLQKGFDGRIIEALPMNNHVEADTRLLFNAKEALHAYNVTADVIVHRPDNNTLVLGISS